MRRLLVGMVAGLMTLAAGCGGDGSGGSLTPARNLVGTWKTSIPVTVFFKTEWCNSPALTLAASQNWTVTWVITPGVDDNHVNVQMSFSSSGTTIIAGCPDTGVVPEVSPMFLTGTISSTSLALRNGSTPAGSFNFTTDILTGTFDYSFCLIYCQQEYTNTNAMILMRQ